MPKRIINIKPGEGAFNYLLSALVVFFLFLYSIILTLSPAVKIRSWDAEFRWTHWVGFFVWLSGYYWFKKTTSKYSRLDESLIIPVVGLLIGWGILSIWRIQTVFGIRQSLWFLISVAISSVLFKHKEIIEQFRRYKYVLLTSGLLLVALTFLFGSYPGGDGPRLWLGSRGIYFQPSELLKLILIIYLSAYLSDGKLKQIDKMSSIFPAITLFLSAMILLIAQKDLGTALIYSVIFLLMVYQGYGKKRILLAGFLILVIVAVIGYLSIDLIRIRFISWVLPWLDAQAGSYQIIQSIIGIASGGLLGTGIGLGSPRVIPISHSDFIYAAIIEETGLFGSIALILLYLLLFTRGIRIAARSKNAYHRFLASGIVIYITAQAIIIIGGNIRLLPITGVTLPFLSYGGSSLLVTFLSACFLLVIDNDTSTFPVNQDQGYEIYKILYACFFSAFIFLAMVTGWWSIVRSSDLQLRSDNPRRFIAARYVKRGAILDRNNSALVTSTGKTGEFIRFVHYPPLSNTIGFSNISYRNSGLEESLDSYLSGEAGYSSFDLWFSYLLYDQPPPGRDIRLTIDLGIQEFVDQRIGMHPGSAVILNAQTGEILALSTYPYFDANAIETNWEQLKVDTGSPLLNRAVQGSYPIGNLIIPFLLSETDQFKKEMNSNSSQDDGPYNCDLEAYGVIDWQSQARNGCDLFLVRTSRKIGNKGFHDIIRQFSLNDSQDIGLPVSKPYEFSGNAAWFDLIFGQEPLRVNPLQIAVSASSFSAEGFIPKSKIVSAINIDNEGWVNVLTSEIENIRPREKSTFVNQFLTSPSISGWEITAKSEDQNGSYTWYLAGTPVPWSGQPIIVVLIIENDNPQLIREIGREIYNQATQKITNSNE